MKDTTKMCVSPAAAGADERLAAVKVWLAGVTDIVKGLDIETLEPASADASFRR